MTNPQNPWHAHIYYDKKSWSAAHLVLMAVVVPKLETCEQLDEGIEEINGRLRDYQEPRREWKCPKNRF